MKKRINLRLILIAGIAVIVTMVCMTGIYYKLFQGQEIGRASCRERVSSPV